VSCVTFKDPFSGYAVRVDIVDTETVVEDPCPGGHTPAPVGYVDRHEWAAKMSKTHKSRRCEVCSKYGIWVPKKKRKKR